MEFYEYYGLCRMQTRQLINPNYPKYSYKGWIIGDENTEHPKRDTTNGGGKYRGKNEKFIFEHPTHGRVVGDRSKMHQKFGISRPALCHIIRYGKTRQGWKLIEKISSRQL